MANCYDIFAAVCTVQQAQYVAVKSESWCIVFWLFVASVQNVLHDYFPQICGVFLVVSLCGMFAIIFGFASGVQVFWYLLFINQ